MPRPFPKKISQIKPTLSNVALTSNYLVEFGGLKSNLKDYLRRRGMDYRFIGETLGLLCSRASLPGSGFATADIVGNFMGVAEKMAHTRTFTQMDLDFYVDTRYNSLKFIEHWMEFISSGSTTGRDGAEPLREGYYFRMRYPKEYKCDETRIIKFEKDYNRYIEYRFFGLFPISLNSTTVSYEGSNILKATASFNYERYVSGKSYSIDQATGTEGNKEKTGTANGDSNNLASQAFSSNLDTGIKLPSDTTFSNYSGIFSNKQMGGFPEFGTLTNTQLINANYVNSFEIL